MENFSKYVYLSILIHLTAAILFFGLFTNKAKAPIISLEDFKFNLNQEETEYNQEEPPPPPANEKIEASSSPPSASAAGAAAASKTAAKPIIRTGSGAKPTPAVVSAPTAIKVQDKTAQKPLDINKSEIKRETSKNFSAKESGQIKENILSHKNEIKEKSNITEEKSSSQKSAEIDKQVMIESQQRAGIKKSADQFGKEYKSDINNLASKIDKEINVEKENYNLQHSGKSIASDFKQSHSAVLAEKEFLKEESVKRDAVSAPSEFQRKNFTLGKVIEGAYNSKNSLKSTEQSEQKISKFDIQTAESKSDKSINVSRQTSFTTSSRNPVFEDGREEKSNATAVSGRSYSVKEQTSIYLDESTKSRDGDIEVSKVKTDFSRDTTNLKYSEQSVSQTYSTANITDYKVEDKASGLSFNKISNYITDNIKTLFLGKSSNESKPDISKKSIEDENVEYSKSDVIFRGETRDLNKVSFKSDNAQNQNVKVSSQRSGAGQRSGNYKVSDLNSAKIQGYESKNLQVSKSDGYSKQQSDNMKLDNDNPVKNSGAAGIIRNKKGIGSERLETIESAIASENIISSNKRDLTSRVNKDLYTASSTGANIKNVIKNQGSKLSIKSNINVDIVNINPEDYIEKNDEIKISKKGISNAGASSGSSSGSARVSSSAASKFISSKNDATRFSSALNSAAVSKKYERESSSENTEFGGSESYTPTQSKIQKESKVSKITARYTNDKRGDGSGSGGTNGKRVNSRVGTGSGSSAASRTNLYSGGDDEEEEFDEGEGSGGAGNSRIGSGRGSTSATSSSSGRGSGAGKGKKGSGNKITDYKSDIEGFNLSSRVKSEGGGKGNINVNKTDYYSGSKSNASSKELNVKSNSKNSAAILKANDIMNIAKKKIIEKDASENVQKSKIDIENNLEKIAAEKDVTKNITINEDFDKRYTKITKEMSFNPTNKKGLTARYNEYELSPEFKAKIEKYSNIILNKHINIMISNLEPLLNKYFPVSEETRKLNIILEINDEGIIKNYSFKESIAKNDNIKEFLKNEMKDWTSKIKLPVEDSKKIYIWFYYKNKVLEEPKIIWLH